MENLRTIPRPNNLRHLPRDLRRARLLAAREQPFDSPVRFGIKAGAYDRRGLVRRYLQECAK